MTRTILAYLDPGSGSLIIQMLLGGVAAVGVALKLYWRRFKQLLGFGKRDASAGAEEPTADAPASSAAPVEAEQQPLESAKS